MKCKIGFIGSGNMATAIAGGLVSSGTFDGNEIMMSDLDESKLRENNNKLGIIPASDNHILIESCEVIVIAVKPNVLPLLLPSLSECFMRFKPLVISIAAGQSVSKIKGFIGEEIHIVRVMPNINALVGEAMSGYAVSSNVTSDEISLAEKILSSFGFCVPVDEELFSAYSSIAGCSPAYAYLFADAVARIGVKYGLTKKDSLKIVSSVMINSSKEILESVNSEKISSLLSDNDKEIIGSSFNADNFDEIIFNCIESALNKDKKV